MLLNLSFTGIPRKRTEKCIQNEKENKVLLLLLLLFVTTSVAYFS